ncbi:2'-5' RNA ligase family protein [Haloarchaeobius sp. HME9146]|uniref:2'-5' RNA ligase family protein n=1 Tax=Haloarchaeobius sp. HME9146 TaxID=2978732 RepID=UPI0021C1E3F0|nr:2'-5' RNA ligase family protein [Haloarchaeobius sp. HME9146]MCT9097297.1 2'-5' RNA ligase family protein [Haloarchaeobius sp. HME9146]
MTYAIVTTLTGECAEEVERLWRDLHDRFGLARTSPVPPHCSYHGAVEYGDDLDESLSRVAEAFDPFVVQTAGIGVFPGDSPVVHVPVVRTDELSLVQQTIFDTVVGAAESPNTYYRPSVWQPHVTLAHGDLTPAELGSVVAFLNDRAPSLSFVADELAVVDTDESGDCVVARFALGG